MMPWDQFVADNNLAADFQAARDVYKRHSSDPISDPFKSLYAYRDAIRSLQELVRTKSVPDENGRLRDCALLICSYYIAISHAESEELNDAMVLFENILTTLEKNESHQEGVGAVCGGHQSDSSLSFILALKQNVYNQLGVLWASRGEHAKAKDYLKQAESIYFTCISQPIIPSLLGDVFVELGDEDVEGTRAEARKVEFESSFTHTCYYVAQVYTHLGDKDMAARYFHVTLKRQFETSQYAPVDWSLNCATLSQFYIGRNDFENARSCLIASLSVFEKHKQEIVEEGKDSDELSYRRSDILRCWTKYAISLMEVSSCRMKALESGDQEQLASVEKVSVEFPAHLLSVCFGGLDFKVNAEHVERLDDKLLTTYEEARVIFIKALKWCADAQAYFSLDDHATDYVEIAQDRSQLYKYLAVFDCDIERKCKMHKRRLDLLNSVLNELNQQFYLQVCQQLIHEIADVYKTLAELKLALLRTSQAAPSNHSVNKINSLIQSAKAFYSRFIKTFGSENEMESKNLPAKRYPDENVRSVLISAINIGRLSSKMVITDVNGKVRAVVESAEWFQSVVDYCDQHNDHKQLVAAEYDISREFLTLLPTRIDNLRNGCD